MHERLLVTFDCDNAATEAEARCFAYKALMESGIVDEHKLYNASLGDCFVIGGRWSGELLTKEERDAKVLHGELEWNEDKSETWAAGHRLYHEEGNEGDAKVLTKELYYQFLIPFEGCSIESDQTLGHFVDLDWDDVCPEFIGTKWLVVGDIHS
jgi:hypothetical protein